MRERDGVGGGGGGGEREEVFTMQTLMDDFIKCAGTP